MTRFAGVKPLELFPEVKGAAVFSDCDRYRYMLARVWDSAIPPVIWIMLNPSTADAYVDDPTIRRCQSFARAWGAGGAFILNLFALRSPYPAELTRHDDPVGPENDGYLVDTVGHFPRARVVAAWGTWGTYQERDRRVEKILGARLHCIGTNRNGTPRHPLYVPSWADTYPYEGRPR
jgi:hypothetical protein